MNEQQVVKPKQSHLKRFVASITTARLVVYLIAAVATVVLVTDPFISMVSFVYSKVIRDQYELYRVQVENSQLQQVNNRMKSELIALKTSHSRAGQLEVTLNQKLTALEELIEKTTGLGLSKAEKRSERQIVANKDGAASPSTGALAAILTSPELAAADSIPSGKNEKPGVGGSEEPCEDDICRLGASRDDISLHGSKTHRDVVVGERGDTRSRFDRLVSIITHLPIGHPAGGEISSGFGRRKSPFTRRASFHHGVDLSLPTGGRVVATGAGTVQRVAYNKTYGTLIDIEHVKGLVTRYAHLAKTLVRPGQRVSRGDLIAMSGSSGRSTGPHLHYEVIHNGRARNPAPFMQLADRLADAVRVTAHG